jgi:hypothetical protein
MIASKYLVMTVRAGSFVWWVLAIFVFAVFIGVLAWLQGLVTLP